MASARNFGEPREQDVCDLSLEPPLRSRLQEQSGVLWQVSGPSLRRVMDDRERQGAVDI
jgi:hypothetical protein